MIADCSHMNCESFLFVKLRVNVFGRVSLAAADGESAYAAVDTRRPSLCTEPPSGLHAVENRVRKGGCGPSSEIQGQLVGRKGLSWAKSSQQERESSCCELSSLPTNCPWAWQDIDDRGGLETSCDCVTHL